MNQVPVVFAFDNNLAFEAAVCISSLFDNARESTIYDVFILYPDGQDLNRKDIDVVASSHPRHKLTYLPVKDQFEQAYEIRGINTLTYYRLLIPELIPQYDKVIYSDVDVIFRDDLSDIYAIELGENYLGAVNSLAHLDPDRGEYYTNLGLDASKNFYAGNIVLNSRLLRDDAMIGRFKEMALKKYKFQDMDILNISCSGRIRYFPPSFCVTTYFCEYANRQRAQLAAKRTDEEINHALEKGIVHYNGPKPWNSWCPNFDIWWETYRKSPIFDQRKYFEFFYSKMDVLDSLTLWKRVKILARYFIVGKK